jgi:simple sugar transport system ATP-binding protein
MRFRNVESRLFWAKRCSQCCHSLIRSGRRREKLVSAGTIVSKGKAVHFGSPRDARAQGIETVYQDLALIGDLSIYHNMFLGREYHKRILGVKLLDNRKMRDLAKTYLDTLGIEIPSVNSTVDLLSGGQRQSVAVARSIYSSPTVLVLDEPLAALGVREGANVLGLIQNLRRQRSVSIILIVHNYNQVFEVCDRINFLHSGEIVLDASTSDTTEEELIRIVKSGLGREAIAAAAAEVQRQMSKAEEDSGSI